jgi:hypothetical protein
MREDMPIYYGDNHFDPARLLRSGLAKTRCSYIKDKAANKHGQSIFGRIPMIALVFGVSLAILFFIGAENNNSAVVLASMGPDFAGDVALFGALFILGGWLEFKLMQTIDDIPTTNIEGAADGLNEINAKFVPEFGDPLVSPLTKQACIYYQVSLEEYVHSGKSSYWYPVYGVSKGVPALMTDGTGYLALPLDDADINNKPAFYYPKNSKEQIVRSATPEGKALIAAFQGDMIGKGFAGMGINFEHSLNTVVDFSIFAGAEMRIIESALPVNTNYFVMGRVADSTSTLKGKPVKTIDYDSGTKLLTVRNESKTGIEKTDKTLAFIALAAGVVMLLGALAYLGVA